MRSHVWFIHCCVVLCMTRDRLISLVDQMDSMGGFAGKIGQAALLADKDNLQRLMDAFPEYFIEQKAISWTRLLFT